MTKEGRIKTDWASLTLAQDGTVIVCVKYNGAPRCMCFNSLEQLKQVVVSKRMLVKKWAIAVPRSSCILKPLVLPASDLDEAVKMIEFELPTLVPIPLDEIVYGCTLLNKQSNMLNVLVCILKLSALNQYLKPYRDVGIEPHRITLNLLAVQNWFNATSASTSGTEISVLVNKQYCAVLTCNNGNLHEANELTLSGGDITKCSREIMQEILRQREELPPPLKKKTMVLLAGAEKYASEVKNLFRSIPCDSTISHKVTVVPNPIITCNTGSGKYEHDDNNLCYEAVMATGLLDLAVKSKFPQSNLLPQQYLKRHQRKALLFHCLFTGSLSFLLILLSWLCLVAMNWRIERVSRKIESQIAPIKHIASSVDSKRQRVKGIQKQLSSRGQITQIVEELYRYTPRAISISELRFTSKHSGASIDIKGQADLLSSAFEYTEAMRKADLLDKIQIVDAQQIPRPDGSVVEFKAHCVIPND